MSLVSVKNALCDDFIAWDTMGTTTSTSIRNSPKNWTNTIIIKRKSMGNYYCIVQPM